MSESTNERARNVALDAVVPMPLMVRDPCLTARRSAVVDTVAALDRAGLLREDGEDAELLAAKVALADACLSYGGDPAKGPWSVNMLTAVVRVRDLLAARKRAALPVWNVDGHMVYRNRAEWVASFPSKVDARAALPLLANARDGEGGWREEEAK